MHAQPLEVPLLFMTGHAAEVILMPAFAEAAVPVLQKPFSADELGLYIREALDGTNGCIA
jgi:FixJ family two-component response regulator